MNNLSEAHWRDDAKLHPLYTLVKYDTMIKQ